MLRLVVVLGAVTLNGCAVLGFDREPQQVQSFLDEVDHHLRDLAEASARAAWMQATHISDDTQWLAARARGELFEYLAGAAQRARDFDIDALNAQSARQLQLLTFDSGVPTDSELLAELTRLESRLEARYGSARYCPPGQPESACLSLGDLEDILRDSRDPEELARAWLGWRQAAEPMKADYARFVELQNIGARELGFADAGALWRARYDMPAAELEAEVERLWQQLRPLYEALHCHVRAELRARYGAGQVAGDGPIPAHLLGNMWAQDWLNLYPLLTPYPQAAAADVSDALQRQGYTAERMVRQAEAFYQSLGLPGLPDSFYRHSMLVEPRDREVVCHASAWDVDSAGDVRIKMCIEPREEDLRTIYHELGHIYYYLAYQHLPLLFQGGAHDGFHEAVGDAMMLGMLSPEYLASVDLIDRPGENREAVINQQLKMALDKVAFLPFGLLIDKWRWLVFAGEIEPQQYTAAWWELKRRYQGVAPPSPRPESAFDPGAKYHIPANTPYLRYFLAHIMQFQFFAAMCEAAGHDGPLHQCSIAGSEPAGARLWAMLQAGQSQPWQDTLQILTGGDRMDAAPMLEYFAPLRDWLQQRNANRSCGW